MFKHTIFLSFILTWCFITTVQSAKTVEECEKKMPESLKGRLCEIRRYTIIDGSDMDKLMDCVMNALEFTDDEGRADYHKLYKPMNAIEEDRKHDINLETCIGNSFRLAKGERANAFYKCMLGTNSADTFKKVFDLTELIKAGKLPEGARYDNTVAKMMSDLDKEICPN